jgi:hypothetical protein
MDGSRRQFIISRIAAAGLLVPTEVTLGRGDSVAVAFEIKGATETIEGCGVSDGDRADDVIRQLRQRLNIPG